MPWRHDVTASRGWVKLKSLNGILWMGPGAMEKMVFLVKATIFSYKINVILYYNVNFDVTIMTSFFFGRL